MPWIHGVMGLLTFVLGAAVGSFLNVCIYRIPWQKSLVWPGSRCPKCLEALSARDNVPVFGWIALGGNRRFCALPISVRSPLVEMLVGFLFVAVYTVDIAMAPRNPFVWGNIATVAG